MTKVGPSSPPVVFVPGARPNTVGNGWSTRPTPVAGGQTPATRTPVSSLNASGLEEAVLLLHPPAAVSTNNHTKNQGQKISLEAWSSDCI